ncbi:MAG TPA: alpha/beta family hydrolase [Vicinamibacteria bacterium]
MDRRAKRAAADDTSEEREVVVLAPQPLPGFLAVPPHARGLVIFAHGSGSSRLSPRNRFVSRAIREAGLGTLLFDLLNSEEERYDERTSLLRFDMRLLADRLLGAIRWAKAQPGLSGLACGLFGASSGGGAALVAAAGSPESVRAVVSRGGRPDLAGEALRYVQAPTLLIVGERDPEVLRLNQQAAALLPAEKRLETVPGASHLFEEAGAIEEVARLARDWFAQYLGATLRPAAPPA